MKFEIVDVSSCKKKLEFEIENEAVVNERNAIEREFGRKAKIPGFRPGKAPLSVIKARFQKDIEEDLKERIITENFRKAMEEKKIVPLHNPILEEFTLNEGEPVKFRVSFEVKPEIKIENYKGMTVKDRKIVVEDEEVNKVLESLREGFSRLETTGSDTAAEGNYVTVKLEGAFLDGKKETIKEENLLIAVGSEENLPEFNTNLPGMKKGEMREFDVAYPENYYSKELASRRIHYMMTLNEVKTKVLPELDDAFAKSVYQTYYAKEKKEIEEKGVETLLELRLFIHDRIEQRKKLEKDFILKNELLTALVEKNEFEIPDAMVEDQINLRMEGFVREMIAKGINPAKSEVNWQEIREKQIEPAKKDVKAKLILSSIAELERIEVSKTQIDEFMKMEARSHGTTIDEVRKRFTDDDIQRIGAQIVRDRVLDFLLSNANITLEG